MLFREALLRAISELAGNSSADINLISWLPDREPLIPPTSKETRPRGYILSPVPRPFRWNLSRKYLGREVLPRKWRGSFPSRYPSRHNAMDRYGHAARAVREKSNYLARD